LTERRFFLDQHGCAKNQVDGELLIGILQETGWVRAAEPEDADLIIVNSCGFIESAKKESIDAVITARTAYPKAKVLLAGCLSERYAEDFKDGFDEADGFFGNGDLSRLPEIVDAMFSSRPATSTAKPVLVPAQKGVCGGDRPTLLSFPRSAYVKITEGCDNCCSFCAIPIIRGSLRSRPIESITGEIRDLVARGVYEINLIGQDLAAFGTGDGDAVDAGASGVIASVSPLARLLAAISSVGGNFRVRLLYIHPDHFPRDILPVMTRDTRFLPYFDIPFQSGDDAIIRAMNRRGSSAIYLELLRDIREAFAAARSPYGTVALRTTFLVGFPGETDDGFANTARFMADIHSMWSGAFTWSCEEGTPAADMKKRVPKKTAKNRMEALQSLQLGITGEELKVFVGKTVEVLVEELIQEHAPGSAGSSGDAASASEADTSDAIAVPVSRLALGRAWFQAPEVDGAVVLQFEDNQKDKNGMPIDAGSVVDAFIISVNGVDVEAVVR
jgi:ribosomal protein S12 methylthiotransferase